MTTKTITINAEVALELTMKLAEFHRNEALVKAQEAFELRQECEKLQVKLNERVMSLAEAFDLRNENNALRAKLAEIAPSMPAEPEAKH